MATRVLTFLVVLALTTNCAFASSAFTVSVHPGTTSTEYSERLQVVADRTFYVAALEVDWDFAPSGSINIITGVPVHDDVRAKIYTKTSTNTIGSKYRKAVYRAFKDATFTEPLTRDAKWMHLGVMGPPIRGIVGERIKIVFFNNCSYNYSMHPHGVNYDKYSEGAVYQDKALSFGDSILSKNKWVYFWDLRENSAGGNNEVSSKFWFYHSHVNEPRDTNAGLVGPILITKKGFETSQSDPSPKDVDVEYVTLFTVFDENLSWYIKHNMGFITNYNALDVTGNDTLAADDDFHESNLMHSMNGFSWGNILGAFYGDIYLGDTVRWYIGGMGTEVDIHTAHWHGNIIKNGMVYEDVTQLMPAYTTTVDMKPDKQGTWFYHCHVNDHVEAGMISTYTVMNTTRANNADSRMANANNGSVDDKAEIDWKLKDTAWVAIVAVFANVLVLLCLGGCYFAFGKRCCKACGATVGKNEPLMELAKDEAKEASYNRL